MSIHIWQTYMQVTSHRSDTHQQLSRKTRFYNIWQNYKF